MNFKRIFRWEFWPLFIIYFPVVLFLLFRVGSWGLRSTGSILHVLSANPNIPFGGLLEYSKYELLQYLPKEYLPKTHYFAQTPSAQEFCRAMRNLGLNYPVYCKPDIGERGRGVARLNNTRELEEYLSYASYSAANNALILQEEINGEEYGVLVLRDPSANTTRITSLVVKEPLKVYGNGRSTLHELIHKGERTRYHIDLLQRIHRHALKEIVPAGELRVLTHIGNHSRGSTFRNGNRLINPRLEQKFSEIMNCIPNFHVGRFDVRSPNFSKLEAGNFKVIEVNAVNSEPAHIYDLPFPVALRDLIQHWNAVSNIGFENIRKGAKPESLQELLRAVHRHYNSETAQRFRKLGKFH